MYFGKNMLFWKVWLKTDSIAVFAAFFYIGQHVAKLFFNIFWKSNWDRNSIRNLFRLQLDAESKCGGATGANLREIKIREDSHQQLLRTCFLRRVIDETNFVQKFCPKVVCIFQVFAVFHVFGGATRLALARRPRAFWWGYPLGSRTASESILVGLPAWLSHGVREHFGGATRLALARRPRAFWWGYPLGSPNVVYFVFLLFLHCKLRG